MSSYWGDMAQCYIQMAMLGRCKEEWDEELRREQLARKFVEDCWADSPEKKWRLEEHNMLEQLLHDYRNMSLTRAQRAYKELSWIGKIKHRLSNL